MEDEKVPTMILFFGSVYSAPIALEGKDSLEQNLIEAVKFSVEQMQPHSSEPLQIKYFYPYISDASFMRIDHDVESIDALKNNMPSWGVKYTHPFDEIKSINVPVANIGSFGHDGHKYTERVHMEHTFQVVPNLTLKAIEYLLGMREEKFVSK